jgi:hypothetical protein
MRFMSLPDVVNPASKRSNIATRFVDLADDHRALVVSNILRPWETGDELAPLTPSR